MKYELETIGQRTLIYVVLIFGCFLSACQTGAEAGYVEEWPTQMLIERIEPTTVLASSEIKLTGRACQSHSGFLTYSVYRRNPGQRF